MSSNEISCECNFCVTAKIIEITMEISSYTEEQKISHLDRIRKLKAKCTLNHKEV